MKRVIRLKFAPALPALFIVLLLAGSACAERWSFTAIADNSTQYASFRRVVEQIKSNGPADPKFPPPQFVLVLGDLEPLSTNYRIYNEIMGGSAPFVPVRGNHESSADVHFMLSQVLPSLKFPLKLHDPASTTYYMDHKNVRFISIDIYTSYGKGLKNPEFIDWVEKAITSATTADHVFIGFHEPYLPIEPMKDPFWGMLLRHSDKVRAVLCGHTHVYARRFVPDTHGGVHYINAGNAGNMGHSDDNLTIVEISVDKKEVLFRALQAPRERKEFKETDRWSAGSRGE